MFPLLIYIYSEITAVVRPQVTTFVKYTLLGPVELFTPKSTTHLAYNLDEYELKKLVMQLSGHYLPQIMPVGV